MPSIQELQSNIARLRQELEETKHKARALLEHSREQAQRIDGYYSPLLQANADYIHSIDSRVPPTVYADWSSDAWFHWQPQGTSLTHTLRYGSLTDTRASNVVLPACAPFIGQGRSIILVSDRGETETGQKLFQSLLTRTALLLPHQTIYTLLDPAGSGLAFPMRRFLPQVQPTGDDVRRDLDAVNAEIRRVIETYIDAATPSFERIPEDIRMNERYHFVFAADFPNKYDRRAIEALQQVAETGPRAGVYTFIHYNTEHELPRDIDMRAFKNGYFLPTRVSTFTVGTAFECWVTPDVPPTPEQQDRLFGKLRDAKPVETKLEWGSTVGIPDEHWWSDSTKTSMETPIGKRGNNELLKVYFGETHDGRPCVHGILGAMTGAGKSNLFHALIAGLAVRYSPEELRLYLVDGKYGVEFQPYTHLPHAEVVSLRTSAELSRSVLRDLVDEMERRNALFVRYKVNNLAGYRELQQPAGILPRVLLVVDEYQQLFEDDRDGVASQLLRQLSEQARSAGIHILLASQRFGAVGMLNQTAIFGNIHLRIAMQMAEADVRGLTEFGQRGKQLILTTCNLPGKVVVNDRAGDDNSNASGKIAFLSKDDRTHLLEAIKKRAQHLGEASLPRRIVLNGEAQPDLIDNPQLMDLLRDPVWLDRSALQTFVSRPLSEGGLAVTDWFTAEAPLVMWVGQEFNVRGQAVVQTRRGNAENIVLVGNNNAVRYGVLAALLVSLSVIVPPHEISFVIIDRSIPDAQWSGVLSHIVDTVLKPLGAGASLTKNDSDIEQRLQSMVTEIERRTNLSEEERLRQFSVFVVLTELDRAVPLQRKPDRYGDLEDSPAGELLGRVYREGPAVGVHVIASFPSVRGMLSIIDERRGLAYFRHRVAFQMSEDESYTFVRSRKAALLQANGKIPISGLYLDVDRDKAIRFKPYSIEADPDTPNGTLTDQITQIGTMLRQRKEHQ